MKNTLPIIALLLSATTITGCASLSSPNRPAYTGADNITSAQPEQLVGIWRVTRLNPVSGTEPQPTIIEYRGDGTVVGSTTIDGEGFGATGPLEFVLSGQWTLDADVVIHQNITMSSKDDSPIGSIISNTINNQKDISGKANIYELSANRIVMLGSDGDAKEYIRL